MTNGSAMTWEGPLPLRLRLRRSGLAWLLLFMLLRMGLGALFSLSQPWGLGGAFLTLVLLAAVARLSAMMWNGRRAGFVWLLAVLAAGILLDVAQAVMSADALFAAPAVLVLEGINLAAFASFWPAFRKK